MTSELVVGDLRAGQGPATILVVEDEIITRAAMCWELREQGYKVIEAGTADEALSVLRSATLVDVVITDRRMPGTLDGRDLARLIRAEFAWLKVIMVSGNPPDDDVLSLLDGYLSKPIAPSALAKYVQTLIPSRAHTEGA